MSSIQRPLRVSTDPFITTSSIKKRIIVCCDGTWQDGIIVKERWKYTNILKLSRALNHVDMRGGVPVPQIVFYQNGIGSSPNLYSEYVQGATGSSLGEKIQEAYAFIAQNYCPGMRYGFCVCTRVLNRRLPRFSSLASRGGRIQPEWLLC
ncbi:hypothetical protein EDC04DRAFT_11000 [Pisolithus marmoratus]|nr:hypothetical protein EDC04DRAFT_11000 [Pisolithus marmoratus]